MANPHDYTVGWICAITTEYVAAQAFLDEEHEGPEFVSTNDNNDYTLGRIGRHNVVITVLPHGEYGISSAAGVARDMLHSFPNVRIGLMVGIGGGAPSPKNDIRLGDVVVSASGVRKCGVFQYDFGKAMQDQEFQETGFLNQPPSILRAAVNGLMAQYEGKGHRLEETIENILEKRPRLRKKYKRPEPSTDRLYRPNIVHPANDESSCAAACGDDLSTLILRAERTEDEHNPAIHYGLIASANTLMKDALIRDELARKKDVLCFEMEAAGLMNHFPCLVIRGICDYSDSHKNKEWQGYGAMTAAAYAKDLLCRITPNRIEAEKKISEVLSVVREGIDCLVRKPHHQEYESIIEWLTPADYARQQTDFFNRRQQGTGQWLLDTEKFQTWVKTKGQTLYCPGIPGAGKTILTSIVVNNLQDRFQNDASLGIAYIYCNFRRPDEQTAKDLLASLLKQLTRDLPAFPDSVKSLHNKHKDRRSRPSFEEISSALQSVTALYSRSFVLIDALDECRASDGSRTRFLAEVFKLQARSGTNIFATSRFIPEIDTKFEGSISLKISAAEEDVRRYLHSCIPRWPAFVRRSPGLQEEVKSGIVHSVQGMFLLAQLHADSLVGKTTVKAVRSALAKLPSGSDAYDHAYETAMERIQKHVADQKQLATQVLLWITCARRPLTISELQHALAVEVGETRLDEDNLAELEEMVSVCAGLVTIDEQSYIIRLVHYTTQQYFDKNRAKWFPNAEADIATTCVTYLSFNVFESGFCPTDEEFEERLRSNPLYDYAANHWGHHAREASTLCQESIHFLVSGAKVESASQALMAVQRGYSQRVPRHMTGLHLVAYFGIENSAGMLISRNYGDSMDSYGRTPLSYAAEKGHAAVAKLLLDTGRVDIDARDIKYATKEAHEAIVELLLATGKVDIDARDAKFGQTPLSWAAEQGYAAVVKLLLDTGRVDANVEDIRHGRTPLSWAAERGHEAVVKLLLNPGRADADVKDIWHGRTPLSWATKKGHAAIVKLLLEEGANAQSRDKYGRTPLTWAAEKGYTAVVKLLLDTGKVDVNLTDEDYDQTPLSYGAVYGHAAVVKLLLETDGIDVNSKDKYCGQTPLSWAARNTHAAVVTLLLKTKGIDVNSKDTEYGRTPLSWAAGEGHETIVRLLLDANGIDVDSADNAYGQTPLSIAAENGHTAIVRLLLEKGANTDSKDTKGRTPLSWAAEKGHQAIVKLLLDAN
ncbi:Uncharacterized protein TPAR_02314 [Tolypocladium paradoxum]|uniref:Uncharacterized protein n=1 Tax=Tolypocladium paradoxum TaxID=94208 RepID=A0A2S4L4V8_9HYPO|nr:Uncharacterized protein TPAR_02314 [Tolypocladium paradoxum]